MELFSTFFCGDVIVITLWAPECCELGVVSCPDPPTFQGGSGHETKLGVLQLIICSQSWMTSTFFISG